VPPRDVLEVLSRIEQAGRYVGLPHGVRQPPVLGGFRAQVGGDIIRLAWHDSAIQHHAKFNERTLRQVLKRVSNTVKKRRTVNPSLL
jgi:hypothetical protein